MMEVQSVDPGVAKNAVTPNLLLIEELHRQGKNHELYYRAVPIYDWEFSIYAYIVYLSYNIRFFVYFSYSRILGNAGGSRSPR
jgi:hypothetical protein